MPRAIKPITSSQPTGAVGTVPPRREYLPTGRGVMPTAELGTTEPPRDLRRLHFLERTESCQVVRRGGTRWNCVSGLRSTPETNRRLRSHTRKSPDIPGRFTSKSSPGRVRPFYTTPPRAIHRFGSLPFARGGIRLDQWGRAGSPIPPGRRIGSRDGSARACL